MGIFVVWTKRDWNRKSCYGNTIQGVIKFIVLCNQGESLNLMLVLIQFLGFGAKNQGGWSNYQGQNRKTPPALSFRVV